MTNIFTSDGKTGCENVLTHSFILLTAFAPTPLLPLPWILLKAAEQRAQAHFPTYDHGHASFVPSLPHLLVPSLEPEQQKLTPRKASEELKGAA